MKTVFPIHLTIIFKSYSFYKTMNIAVWFRDKVNTITLQQNSRGKIKKILKILLILRKKIVILRCFLNSAHLVLATIRCDEKFREPFS